MPWVSGVMPSPETTSSTRRFTCRPAPVALSAMGCSGPWPTELMASGGTPWLTRKSLAASARSRDSLALNSGLPVLSV